jgi:hypothetical protein
MFAFTVFDVVKGFDCQHFFRLASDSNEERIPLDLLNDIVKLKNEEIILKRSMGPVFVICKRRTDYGVLTWIGKYAALPVEYAERDGSYFGVGLWFLGSYFDKNKISKTVKTIEKSEARLRELLRRSDIYSWNVKKIDQRSLEDVGDIIDKNDPIISRRSEEVGIGSEPKGGLAYCIVEPGFGGRVINIEKAVDSIINGPTESDISRVIVAQGPEAASALRQSRFAIELPLDRVARSPAIKGSTLPTGWARSLPEPTGTSDSRHGVAGVTQRSGAAVFGSQLAELRGDLDQFGVWIRSTRREVRLLTIVAVLNIAALSGMIYMAVRDRAVDHPPREATSTSKSSDAPSVENPTGPPSERSGSRVTVSNDSATAHIPGASAAPTGPDESSSNARPAEASYDAELVGLIATIDNFLRRKELKKDTALRTNLEHSREEAQKKVESMRSLAPNPSPPLAPQ